MANGRMANGKLLNRTASRWIKSSQTESMPGEPERRRHFEDEDDPPSSDFGATGDESIGPDLRR
jgi:hypothetical protein